MTWQLVATVLVSLAGLLTAIAALIRGTKAQAAIAAHKRALRASASWSARHVQSARDDDNKKGVLPHMAFYLAQVSGLLNTSFPWSMNAVLSASGSETSTSAVWDTAIRGVFTNASLAPYIPTTVEITDTSVSTASAVFKQTTKTSVSGSTPGAGTDPALPYHTCEIITFRTLSATKWGRGRWFFPPLGFNALAADGFSLLAAAQTAMQTAFNAYFTAIGSSYQHVILHRRATAGGARAAYTTDIVAAADIPSTFAVQRRRADKLVPSRLTVTV
jgi:hypothetical protein